MDLKPNPPSRTSLFGSVEPYAGDPILSLYEAFQADPRPDKVNLGIGVYTDADGRLPVLGSVNRAAARMGQGPRPYLPMDGDPGFRAAVRRLVLGADHPALIENRVATIQSLGGTGAVAIAADFLAKHRPGRPVLISDPTWENHHGLFQRAGFVTATYPYFDAGTRGLDLNGLLAALTAAPDGAIVLIQPVCHNPTGVDPSRAEEEAITERMLAKGHIAVFDMAYQGYAEGLDEDAGFVRRYAARSRGCVIANSFSKIFSLYGERAGGLSVVCADLAEAERVQGQLKLAVRRSYSSPPTTGARLVAEILGDPDLEALWRDEVAAMRERMVAMRIRLADAIARRSNTIDTGFLTRQRGMFSYTGLSAAAVETMRTRDGVYLVESGRLCVAGLTEANVEKVADAYVAVAG